MKKKNKDTIKEEKPEETKVTQATSNSLLNYKGQVKVTIKNGKKVVSSKTYHNAGGNPLFDFLLNCIKGSYDSELKPSYIKLFTRSDSGAPADVVIDDNSTAVCAGIYHNTISEISSIESGGKSMCLHFTVPCSYLSLSGTSNPIKQAGLYCPKYVSSENKTQYSACFNFTKNNGTEWDPIEVTSSIGDYNIFIEWTMTLK